MIINVDISEDGVQLATGSLYTGDDPPAGITYYMERALNWSKGRPATIAGRRFLISPTDGSEAPFYAESASVVDLPPAYKRAHNSIVFRKTGPA